MPFINRRMTDFKGCLGIIIPDLNQNLQLMVDLQLNILKLKIPNVFLDLFRI